MDRFKIMNDMLSRLTEPIEEWFGLFMDGMAEAVRPGHPYLEELVRTGVLNFNGKHLRPILTLLLAKSFGRTDTDNIISSAVAVELVHIASLIHDDILDEASYRHGVPTPNSVLGAHAAVLAGDYVLSRGVYYPLSKGNRRAVDLLVDAMEQLVEGELLQKGYSDNLNIDQEGYFKVISMKTSCLIGIAARLGAPLSLDREMSLLGDYLGAAFQIKDDMLDIWSSKTGKDRYNDFKERKITLPLIFAMEEDPTVAGRVREILSSEVTDRDAAELASIVTSGNALSRLEAKLSELEQKSKAIVSTLPDGDSRRAMFSFVEFMAGRNY